MQSGDLGLVSCLVDFGADINIRNYDGASPLIWAVEKEDCDMVRLLLKLGADPSVFGSPPNQNPTSSKDRKAKSPGVTNRPSPRQARKSSLN